jgi:hypothetical protein
VVRDEVERVKARTVMHVVGRHFENGYWDRIDIIVTTTTYEIRIGEDLGSTKISLAAVNPTTKKNLGMDYLSSRGPARRNVVADHRYHNWTSTLQLFSTSSFINFQFPSIPLLQIIIYLADNILSRNGEIVCRK